ncbi:unnamed protein product [Camellia sinensis]
MGKQQINIDENSITQPNTKNKTNQDTFRPQTCRETTITLVTGADLVEQRSGEIVELDLKRVGPSGNNSDT